MTNKEGTHNGFSLSSTQGKRRANNTVFYRLHALKSEGEVFTVRSCMTEDYLDFHQGVDPFPILKEDAMQETKRRIDAGDFEAKRTYESTITLKRKTAYEAVQD